jgi:lysophospholipase L1-like esterase
MRLANQMRKTERGLRRFTKRGRIGVVVILALALFCASGLHAETGVRWVDAWCAPPDSAGPSFSAQTVRQVIRTSIGGSSVRVRLSNLFGTAPVTIGPVHVAARASGSATRSGTDRAVTFGGKPTVTIAKGAEVLSDPIAFPVAAFGEIAVSMYLPGHTGSSTVHTWAMQTTYITLTGDATAATIFPPGEVASSRFFLTDVEVAAGSAARTIVAVGDSITDGYGSTLNQNARWPDSLAARLRADPAFASIAVVNAGIGGNRILNDGVGPSTLSRFDRDVLNKAGVRWILLLVGINDIGDAGAPSTPKDDVSAQQIIDAMKSLVARAHDRGIKIVGATLTPYGGVDWPYHSPAGEAKRRAVNSWIRAGGTFDGFVDFEQAVRDPKFQDRMLPANDSGDHLHPSDAGYTAMAGSIDLRLFSSDN